MLKVGCCGFPQARSTYFRHFLVVEVQQTFYQPPRLATLERWRREAPPGFEFTLKAWQLVTHLAGSPTYRRLKEPLDRPEDAGFFQPTDLVFAAWERTRQAARCLSAPIILFQCPASFTPCERHTANMRAFFSAIERDDSCLAWEPRGLWPDILVEELCRELDLVHCVDPYKRRSVHGRPAYFRLHGREGYRYRYSDGDLQQLAGYCAAQETAYCLFNNMTIFEDARRFRVLTDAEA